MTQQIAFGQWLKSRRRNLDFTQQALADQVHCSAEMIYRIEAGQRRPSVQVARLLGTVLNVPATELDAFVKFARATEPLRTITHHNEITPWRDAFIPNNNLPLQLTALIGREKHLADAFGRLRLDEVRLLTLVGPPGVGKTRLAIQLGNDALLDFPDGVYFVELAAITQPDRVVIAIARTLDIALADHRKPQDSLHAYLYERRMLIILDNFEQILAAAPDIHAMLVSCPLVKVVVTSREPLRIRGERQFPVKPLALPGRIDDLSERGLAGFAAVQLFLERARAVQPDFELTPDNGAAVAAVCAQLDGLPLAIEIAAAQVAILQPEEILKGANLLESRGMIDSDRRHHSLSAAIQWSHQLLNNGERMFFRRLGVFVDGCTLEAARSVCRSQHDIVLMLSKLAGMNLIKPDVVNDRTSRYRMLEIIRQFARHELQIAGEWQEIQAEHAAYFHAFALAHEEAVRSNGQVAGLEVVEREHNNLQATLDYFIASQNWEKGLELIAALSEFWVYRNHILIGLNYATTLLDQTVNEPALELSRARALNSAAMLSYFAGDFPAVGSYAQAGLDSAHAAQSDRDIARACITLGMQSGGMGNFDAAVRYFEQGIVAVEEKHLSWEMSSLLNGLGEVARSQGHYEKSLEYYTKALDISERMGNLWLSAHILDNMGHTVYLQGLYDIASDYVRRSMKASITLGDERGIAMCLEKLGGIAIAQRQVEFAARLLGAAEVLREVRNTPIEGMDAADYGRFVEQLREQVAADVLEVTWNEGRQMRLSQLLEQILKN